MKMGRLVGVRFKWISIGMRKNERMENGYEKNGNGISEE